MQMAIPAAHSDSAAARDSNSAKRSGSYGENMLNLTCARGYIKKLIDNGKGVRFLNANYLAYPTG